MRVRRSGCDAYWWWVRGNDQAVTPLARERRCDLRWVACRHGDYFYRELLRGGGRRSGKALGGDAVRIKHGGNVTDTRRDLLEQLQQFCADARLEDREASQVAARMRQALHEALGNWVATPDEYDGYRAGRLLHRAHRRNRH
jgi:hypothetical protein